MAKKQETPGFTRKRKLLFGEKTKPEKLRETGEAFMATGHYDDALEFFERCGADDLTRSVARKALESGNVPLFMRAKRAVRDEVTPEEWGRAGKGAEKAGLLTMAGVAYERAGMEEDAARIRALVPGLAEEEGPEESDTAADEEAPPQ